MIQSSILGCRMPRPGQVNIILVLQLYSVHQSYSLLIKLLFDPPQYALAPSPMPVFTYLDGADIILTVFLSDLCLIFHNMHLHNHQCQFLHTLMVLILIKSSYSGFNPCSFPSKSSSLEIQEEHTQWTTQSLASGSPFAQDAILILW